jgi:hypothetical protein
MSSRLPVLPRSTDKGYIYVAKRGDRYKIGFSRAGVARRVRDAESELVLTIPTGQQPSQLEYVINRHFASKRLTDTELYGREWFALDDADVEWLRGLAAFVTPRSEDEP